MKYVKKHSRYISSKFSHTHTQIPLVTETCLSVDVSTTKLIFYFREKKNRDYLYLTAPDPTSHSTVNSIF